MYLILLHQAMVYVESHSHSHLLDYLSVVSSLRRAYGLIHAYAMYLSLFTNSEVLFFLYTANKRFNE